MDNDIKNKIVNTKNMFVKEKKMKFNTTFFLFVKSLISTNS
jgi:hypothetical protein